jgi:AraC-like DNA-binding protein
MDNFSIHLTPLPRRYPHSFPLTGIGYMPHKKNWMRNVFSSVSFSFILKGEGNYLFRGREYPVKAPCVVTEWPSEFHEYGPYREWEEFYLMYAPELRPELERCGLANIDKPVWYIEDPAPCRQKIAEIAELREKVHEQGCADRIDRMGEALILETYLREKKLEIDHKAAAIRSVRALVEAHCEEEFDFDELALDQELSPSSFRREWNRRVGLPPSKYVTVLRIRKACRLLAETNLPVQEIAESLNFSDPLYFSRKFRQIMNCTATEYRLAHSHTMSISDAGG